MVRVRVASALATLLLVGVLAAPASAQDYTPPAVSVSDTTVVIGQTITISGTGFGANTAITIVINPTLTTTANAAGSWSTDFTVTSELAPGTHTVTATGGGVTASTNFSVEGADDDGGAAARTGGPLPRTGSDNSSDYVRWGLALVGVGGVLVAFGRHRWVRRRSVAAG